MNKLTFIMAYATDTGLIEVSPKRTIPKVGAVGAAHSDKPNQLGCHHRHCRYCHCCCLYYSHHHQIHLRCWFQYSWRCLQSNLL